MDFMEYSLSKFQNDIADQFGLNVFYNNVLIRVFYYLLEKRINTRILFLMTTYRRVLHPTKFGDMLSVLQVPSQPIVQRVQNWELTTLVQQGWVANSIECFGKIQSNEVNVRVCL